MAVNTGDTFVIPVRVEDLASDPLKKIAEVGARLTSGFDRAKISIIALNQALDLMGRAVRVLGSAFESTAGKAIALEKSVAEITTLIDGSTNATQMFTEQILTLQSTFGIGQQEIAKAYYEALSSGAVTATNSTDFLIAAQKLATGGATTLDTAIDGLTSILNAYGLQVSESSRISDAFFIGAKAGKTRIEELSRELGNAAPLAYATGVAMEELVGAVSAITIGGVKTNQAVTQVESALMGLSRQTPQLTAVLDKLGMSNIKVAVQSKGLVNVLKMIIAETDGSTESLVELFGRVEAVQGILALTGKTVGSKFTDIMKEMGAISKDAGKVTEEAFQKLTKTTDYQMTVLKGQIEANLTRVGYVIKDIIIPILKALSDSFQSVMDVAASFGRAIAQIDLSALKREADIIIVALASLGAAMAIVFKAQISQAIVNATALMWSYSKAVWAAAAPWALLAAKVLAVTAVVMAAVAAVEIVIRNISQFGTLLEAVGGVFISWGLRIQRFFEGVLLAIMTTQLGIAEGMNKVGIVSDQTLAKMGKDAQAQADRIDELNSKIEETDADIKEVSRSLDFGFTGEVIKQATSAIRAFNGQLEGTAEKAKVAQEEVKKITGADNQLVVRFELKGEDKKALEEFVKRTKDMNTSLKESDMTQREIIESRKMAALEEIRALESKLTAQKNLSKEGKAQLQKIQEFKAAVEATAGQQLEQKGLSGPLGGGAIEAAGNMMGEVAATAMQAMNPVGMVMGAAEAIVGMIQKLIDFIPQILNAVANIFSSLADLPMKILEAVQNVFSSFTKLISDFIPNILKMVDGIAEASVNFLAEGLPNAVQKLGEAIPALMTKTIEGLPELAKKIAQGLVKSNPMILVTRLWMAIIKGLPKFIKAVIKAIPEIVKEFVNGFLLAAQEFINEISNALGMGDLFKIDTKGAEEQLQDLGDKLSRSTSQVFQVVDLEAAARGMDVADKIRNAINSSLTRGKNILEKLWAALKQLWDKFIRPILDFFINGLKATWKLITKLWDTMIKNLRATWDMMVKVFQQGVKTAFEIAKKIWDAMVQILKVTWDTMTSALKVIWDGITQTMRVVWDTITRTLSSTWNTITSLFKGVVDFFTRTWRIITDLFSGKISFLEAVGKMWGNILTSFTSTFQTLIDYAKNVFEIGAQGFQKVFDIAKDVGTKIWEGLKEGIQAGWEVFSNSGKSIFDALKSGLDSIVDIFTNFGKAIMEGAKSAIGKIQEAFDQLNPANLFNKIFKVDMGGRGTVENAVGVDIPFMAFAKGGMVPGNPVVGGDSSLNDRILALLSPGEAVVPRSIMEDPFLSKLIKAVLEGRFKVPEFAFGGVKVGGTLGKVLSGDTKGAVSDIQNMNVQSALDQLDPRNLWNIIGDKVLKELLWKMFAKNKFAEGGVVDSVPAMLSPGEFVVNRDAARANMSLLNQMNRTNVPVSQLGETNQVVNVTINAKTDLSPEQIRREVIPTLEKELKKKSQQGRYIISQAGVRA